MKVAVIDSGIGVTHEWITHRVKNRVCFFRKENAVLCDNDVTDMIGHGTAVTGIILEHAPAAEIFAVKIFHNELKTKLDVLCESIRWSVDNGMDVINLSLGTSVCNERLKRECSHAFENNTIIVAAGNNDGSSVSYPAAFSNVIGVTGGDISRNREYYYCLNRQIEFVAKGKKQRLAWINRSFVFLAGNSFAAPHITGIVALIRQAFPKLDYWGVRELLIANAKRESPASDMNEILDGQSGSTNGEYQAYCSI